ncbi:MAG: type I 3-dehydroquinate dehydratase [Planctomycetes bacterium]|nr:type I 3-dehydroquinate dehydratase [Planctomycetota bacterium]
MSLIAVAIAVDSADEVEGAIAAAQAEAARGATMIEWRVDGLAGHEGALESIARLVKNTPKPCIVTIRSSAEGGGFSGDEEERLNLLLAVCKLDAAPSCVDLELGAFQKSPSFQREFAAAKRSTRLILSSHDFEGRPADLHKRIAAMWSEPLCSIAKVAWRARSVRDNLEAFELLHTQHKPTIALCMGPFGIASRVLAPKFNGFLTYARAEGDLGTAPGQLSVQELKHLYHLSRLTRSTRVFGVVGWPVEHSLSPLLHNAAFAAADFDGAYVPFAVPSEWEHFKASVGELFESPLLQLGGLSITLPHKEHALRWCKERGGTADAVSEWCGAANTLVKDLSGTISAVNTDAPAAVAALATGLGIDQQASARLASGDADHSSPADVEAAARWSRQRVAVLGAGGATRAIVAGLLLAGAEVVVANRTHERASQLAAQFNQRKDPGGREARVKALPLDQLAAHSFNAIVNATSAGMTGGGSESSDPLPADCKIAPGMAVMDMVYRPRETPLVRRARKAGAVVIDGTQMFLRQAAIQFQMFTGRNPPMKLWSELLEQKLSGPR